VVCDVDDARLAKGVELCEKKRGRNPDTVKDFRPVLKVEHKVAYQHALRWL
jgi:hypothetical protein